MFNRHPLVRLLLGRWHSLTQSYDVFLFSGPVGLPSVEYPDTRDHVSGAQVTSCIISQQSWETHLRVFGCTINLRSDLTATMVLNHEPLEFSDGNEISVVVGCINYFGLILWRWWLPDVRQKLSYVWPNHTIRWVVKTLIRILAVQ